MTSAAPVRFGLTLGGFAGSVPAPAELVDLARRAEAAGFDSVQIGDHVQWHAPLFESTTLMATLAAVTTSLRIGSGVIILPLRDPVLLAKTIASLDVLSGGRVILGVGVGGENPAEYAAMRVPLGERGSRANESLEIIRGLFANESFSYKGRHFEITDVAIAPRPLQPSLPIWVGGGSEAALQRAARYGDGWIGAFASERKFARLAGTLREFRAAARRAMDGFTLGTVLFVNVDPDAGRAREAGGRYLERVYRLPGESLVERYGAAGPVEAVVERLSGYLSAGAGYLVLYPVCDHREWPRQLDRYGEIIARMAKAGGGS